MLAKSANIVATLSLPLQILCLLSFCDVVHPSHAGDKIEGTEEQTLSNTFKYKAIGNDSKGKISIVLDEPEDNKHNHQRDRIESDPYDLDLINLNSRSFLQPEVNQYIDSGIPGYNPYTVPGIPGYNLNNYQNQNTNINQNANTNTNYQHVVDSNNQLLQNYNNYVNQNAISNTNANTNNNLAQTSLQNTLYNTNQDQGVGLKGDIQNSNIYQQDYQIQNTNNQLQATSLLNQLGEVNVDMASHVKHGDSITNNYYVGEDPNKPKNINQELTVLVKTKKKKPTTSKPKNKGIFASILGGVGDFIG